MIERIGYILATDGATGDDQHADDEELGLGFLPCDFMGEPWSAKQESESAKLGFRRVFAVISDVTRSGSKIHHKGIQAHFMKTVSDEQEARLRTIPESVIVGIVNKFYDELAKRKADGA
jgi:cytosine/adenosine deaminase-related metal-dependent hydrolase